MTSIEDDLNGRRPQWMIWCEEKRRFAMFYSAYNISLLRNSLFTAMRQWLKWHDINSSVLKKKIIELNSSWAEQSPEN